MIHPAHDPITAPLDFGVYLTPMHVLDKLIAAGLGDRPRERITPQELRAAMQGEHIVKLKAPRIPRIRGGPGAPCVLCAGPTQRHGKDRGRQRYQCLRCSAKFVFASNMTLIRMTCRGKYAEARKLMLAGCCNIDIAERVGLEVRQVANVRWTFNRANRKASRGEVL
jgi:transposase-like protein